MPLIQTAEFVSKSAWMIPFKIAEFKDTVKTLRTLPGEIELYGIKYRLAGYTMASRGTIGHFTGVILWKGGEFYYDGMLPESIRLVPLNENIHFSNKEGSNAIYLLSVE